MLLMQINIVKVRRVIQFPLARCIYLLALVQNSTPGQITNSVIICTFSWMSFKDIFPVAGLDRRGPGECGSPEVEEIGMDLQNVDSIETNFDMSL